MLMQKSSIIAEVRALSQNVLNDYEGKILAGPTGHSYAVTPETFKSDFSHYLQSYEFAILAKATIRTMSQFPDAIIVNHFHDGNVHLVREKPALCVCKKAYMRASRALLALRLND
jgi:hypothetical protein